MAKLTAAARKNIAPKNFAGPDKSYPIEDKNHAKAALSMSSRFAPPAVKSKVKATVKRKYPGLEKGTPQTLHQRMKLNNGRYS